MIYESHVYYKHRGLTMIIVCKMLKITKGMKKEREGNHTYMWYLVPSMRVCTYEDSFSSTIMEDMFLPHHPQGQCLCIFVVSLSFPQCHALCDDFEWGFRGVNLFLLNILLHIFSAQFFLLINYMLPLNQKTTIFQ